MGLLSNISGAKAVKMFEQLGWSIRGQVGSHVIMTKASSKANLSVPQHKELSVGTLRALIRAAEIDVQDFLRLK